MNLTWHIARKDIRRFWIPLVILCVITLIRFGTGIVLLRSDGADPAAFAYMALYANVLWGVGLAVTYMLVAAVVQEDAVASMAFWQTRPISRSRLLAAKALGMTLMFGLLPLLLSVPWWLGCGLGWSDVGAAACQTAAIQGAVVLLALPWAAVTGNFGRFLLWTLVAAVGWATAAMLLAGHITLPPTGYSSGTDLTRLLVIGLLAAAGGLAVTVHQFLARRTWRSIGLIVLVAAAMVATGRWWAWDASALWALRPVPPGSLAKDIRIAFDRANAYTTSPEGATVADVSLFAAPVPQGYFLSTLYVEQDMTWADGSVSRQGRYDMWSMPRSLNDAFDLLHVSPEARDQRWMDYTMRHNIFRWTTPDRNEKWNVNVPLVLPAEAAKRFAGEKPGYAGTFWFRLLEPQVVGEGAIRVGSVVARGAEHTRIAAVAFDEERQWLRLSLVERHPGSLVGDILTSAELRSWDRTPLYSVVNTKRTYVSSGYDEGMQHALIDSVAIVLRNERFEGRSRWNPSTHRWAKERGSLEGATLAEVTFRDAETFSLPLTIDHFSFLERHARGADGSAAETYTVTGEAVKPGAYRFFPEDTLVNALRSAGGVTDQADLNAVVLTHAVPDGAPTRTVVNVEAWLERKVAADAIPALHPGDIVEVPAQTPDPPR